MTAGADPGQLSPTYHLCPVTCQLSRSSTRCHLTIRKVGSLLEVLGINVEFAGRRALDEVPDLLSAGADKITLSRCEKVLLLKGGQS
jgi:hypothetical protein